MKSFKNITIMFVFLSAFCCFQGMGAAQNAKNKTDDSVAKASSKAPASAQKHDAETAADPNSMFPAVVARLNGQPVSGRELETLVRGELVTMGNPLWKDLREDYRNELTAGALSTLLNTNLMYQKAVASGTKVTEEEIQTGIKNYSSRFGSDAELNEALAQQSMDRESLRSNVIRDLTISKYIEASIVKTVTVTDEEIAKYYTANPTAFSHPDIVRSSHILIRAGATADLDAQAKQRAEALLARAKKGEDFAKLAKDNSADGSASAGGDLGFAKKDDMVPEFSDAIFSMTVGEIRLVKTEFGYHVVKVTDRKKEGISTLEEVKEDLTSLLKRNKSQEEMAKLVKKLRDEAKVELLISNNQPSAK